MIFWTTPKINWNNSDPIRFKVDFYRIEKNIEYLKYLLR